MAELTDEQMSQLTGLGPCFLHFHPELQQSGSFSGFAFNNAHGFIGAVDSPTTSPTLTLSIGVTGLLKGVAGSIVAATGADYVAPGWVIGNGIQMNTNKLLGRSSGAFGGIEELTIGSGLVLTGGTLSAVTGGGGTVTSVGLSLPSIFSVTGSPITGAGTLTAAWVSQTANTVLAAPNGSAGTPTFRALVAADIPSLNYLPLSGGTLTGSLSISVADGAQPLRLVSASSILRTRYIDATNGFVLEANNSAETAYSILGLTGSSVRINTGNGANAAVFDGSGNLGLMTGTYGWVSGYKSLDAFTYLSMFSSNNGSGGLASNSYYNGTNWVAKSTNPATRFECGIDNGGDFRWLAAGSVSAGTAHTFIERMRIDTNGNLGVNNTTPTFKVDVIGPSGNGIRYSTSGGVSIALAEQSGAGFLGTTSAHNLNIVTGAGVKAVLDTAGSLAFTNTSSARTISKTIDWRGVWEGTLNGYLLFAKAYVSGTQVNSEVSGTIYLSRGSASSGRRTETFEVYSKSAYNTENFVINWKGGRDFSAGTLHKVTYGGVVYHALRLGQTGGGPDRAFVFDGFTENAGLIVALDSEVSGVVSFGVVGQYIGYDSTFTWNGASVLTGAGGTVSGNNHIDFGPNSTWGAMLRVGGNGLTDTTKASVVTTDGNLHLDGADTHGVYLNYYSSGPVYANGANQVLHAANYNSYSPTLTGGGASGTWGISITGNAATATNLTNTGTVTLASATESNAIYVTAPTYSTDTPVKLLNFDWYGNLFSLGNIRSGATPSNGFGVYYTASGGSRTEIARFGTDASLNVVGALKQGGNQVLHSGNYTGYSPSLTGSGASGTWGISISGNAATASNGGVTSVNGLTGAVTVSGGMTTVAPQSLVGVTGVTITGIPSSARQIIVIVRGALIAAGSGLPVGPNLRLGTSAGVDTTSTYSSGAIGLDGLGSVYPPYSASTTNSYFSAPWPSTLTANFRYELVLASPASNTWMIHASGWVDGPNWAFGAGSKVLSGTLDRIYIGTTSARTFSAGEVSILYN